VTTTTRDRGPLWPHGMGPKITDTLLLYTEKFYCRKSWLLMMKQTSAMKKY